MDVVIGVITTDDVVVDISAVVNKSEPVVIVVSRLEYDAAVNGDQKNGLINGQKQTN